MKEVFGGVRSALVSVTPRGDKSNDSPINIAASTSFLAPAIRCGAALVVLLLAAAPAAATPIDLTGLARAAAVEARSSSSVPAYPGAGRWGGLPPAPTGYAPDLYTYSYDVLRALMDGRTLASRSTDLLAVSTGVHAGARSEWRVNTYSPTPRADGRFAERSLQVAVWQAVYGSAGSGIAASRALEELAALYQPPAGHAGMSWLSLARQRAETRALVPAASFVPGVAGLVLFTAVRRLRRHPPR